MDAGYILEPLTPQSFPGPLSVAPGKLYTLGRSNSCDLVLKDGRISRKQCQLFVDPSSRALILFHGVSEAENVGEAFEKMLNGCKRKRESDPKRCSHISVDGGRILVGISKILAPGCKVSLVVSVKNLPEIGFRVASGAQLCMVKELDVQFERSNQVCMVKNSDVNFEAGEGCTVTNNEVQVFQQRKLVVDLDHYGHAKRVKASVDKLVYESMQVRSELCTQKLVTQNARTLKKHEFHIRSEVEIVSGSKAVKQNKFFQSSGFCCNLLEETQPSSSEVSLMELFSPVDDLQEVFLATFTSDILWFMSSANLPKRIPVTIACHDNERSWSTSIIDRVQHPYPEWPNLKLVFPPFPVLRRTKDQSTMRGVGCHHPKLMLLKRGDCLRVVVTSANLNYRQWFQVSNTLWWQDFPLQKTRDFKSLFNSKVFHSNVTTGDFAAQLAAFICSLVKDVPSEAHWGINLANYDFSRAAVSLVTSVPGFHEVPLERSQAQSDYLGTFTSSVVGICYNYRSRADPNGARLRKLALIVSSLVCDADGLITVTLRRACLPADSNAVAVYVISRTEPDEIHIGFLPRKTAQWVACLMDGGFCKLTASLWPKQVLAVASDQSKLTVELVIDVFEGPSFVEVPGKSLSVEQEGALTNLLRHMQRKHGIWRLEDVLSSHRWPDAAEVDFVYCSSSLGTSLNSKFVAAFSAAAGRRATPEDDYESDPEWGCWTSKHEQRNPSIKILFPTAERVKESKRGPSSFRGILCFPEKTWKRIGPETTLYDAAPHPVSRDGYPMHVKVACRRFKSSGSTRAFGWVYTGSHNFSPSAWGKCVMKSGSEDELGRKPYKRLHICNYELGIVFTDPPGNRQREGSRIDDFCLPFVIPPPRYSSSDRPATGKAIFELVSELGQAERTVIDECAEMESEMLPSELEVELQDSEEDDGASSAYVEQLIPQYHGSDTRFVR